MVRVSQLLWLAACAGAALLFGVLIATHVNEHPGVFYLGMGLALAMLAYSAIIMYVDSNKKKPTARGPDSDDDPREFNF